MRLSFTHGPIAYQEAAGQPTYLQANGGHISLVVAPRSFEGAIAHGDADYHVVISSTVPTAWGPVTVGQTNYLFIGLDPMTAGVVYGTSLLEPVTGAIPPASPSHDQHWFDTTTRTMRVWNASRAAWSPVIRLFVGRVVNGNTSQIIAAARGTTVGVSTPSTPGYVLLDEVGRPIRSASPLGSFITTQTRARAQTTSGGAGVAVSPGDNLIPVRAGENLAAFSAVYLHSDGSARLASGNPAEVNVKVPIGLVRDALYTNQVGVLVQSGELASDSWSWPIPGAPLYVDAVGQLTTTRPQGLLAHRVGFVKDERSIIVAFDAETQPPAADIVEATIYFTPEAPLQVSEQVLSGERFITHTITPASSVASGAMTAAHVTQLDAATAGLVNANTAINNLTTSKANVGHTHDMTQVDGLTTALDQLTIDLTSKADKVSGATAGNFAGLTAGGNLQDSGFKGADFAPLVHFHTIGDVSGLVAALNGKAARAHLNSINEIFVSVDRSGGSDVPTGASLSTVLDGYVLKAGDTMIGALSLPLAPSDPLHAANKVYVDGGLATKSSLLHGHSISGITGLQAALDGKTDIGHVHGISDTVGLQAALDGKSDTGHTHTISNVTNLQFTLDGKSDVGHAHAIADVTNLQFTLDGKAALVHNHALSSLSDVNTTGLMVGDTLAWDGTEWVPGSEGGGSEGGGSAAPLNEIVFGTGSGVDSNANFTYYTNTNSLYVNVPTVLNEDAEIILRSGDNLSGFGHSEILMSTALSGAASTIYLKAGAGAAGADGGGVNIKAGAAAGGGMGGTVTVIAGNSPGGTGGDAYLSAGTGTTRGQVVLQGGEILFEVMGTEFVRFSNSNELLLQGSAGTAGQMLTSAGTAAAPYWSNVPAPAVRSWGQLNTATVIPRVADLALWKDFALPVDNVMTAPGGLWPHPDILINTTFLSQAPVLTLGLEDPGFTNIDVNDNGMYLVAVRARVIIEYANASDEIDGFVRISCHQVSSDAAENGSGNRLIGYIDVHDHFTPAQRAAGLAAIDGGVQFQVDVNAVWEAGLYYSDLHFKVANYVTDKVGSVGPAVVSIKDARVRVTRLVEAGYPAPV